MVVAGLNGWRGHITAQLVNKKRGIRLSASSDLQVVIMATITCLDFQAVKVQRDIRT